MPKDRAGHGRSLLRVDPRPSFDLSPYLFMQFMEPLGTTDGSVEAAWDFQRECWREDVVEAAQQLGPALVRWGGIFSSYYRWREGVGPRNRRKPAYNLRWGGVETNQVGTHELVELCRRIGAEPLIGVNFESEGLEGWARPLKGGLRRAGPKEAAEWVDYCNSPANPERRRNGAKAPFGVRLWQIGNETSYHPKGYDCETAARRTLAFARAMHKADPGIELIGWGDDEWAPRMLEIAGEHLSYIAFHHHFGSGLKGSPLRGAEYRRDASLTWRHLMNAWKSTEARIGAMRQAVSGYQVSLALTESHFSLPGRNRCEVLSTWAAGVACARVLNVHARNGDILKIATLADFFGTRWMSNAIMIPVPQARLRAYLMPVARVMALYRHHSGKKAAEVVSVPRGLDVTTSRSGKRVFLHVVNTNLSEPVRTKVQIDGMKIAAGRVFEIADSPFREIDETMPDLFSPKERRFPAKATWVFPAASVTAVELQVREKGPRTPH